MNNTPEASGAPEPEKARETRRERRERLEAGRRAERRAASKGSRGSLRDALPDALPKIPRGLPSGGLPDRLKTPEGFVLGLAVAALVVLVPLRWPLGAVAPFVLSLAAVALFLVPGLVAAIFLLGDRLPGLSRLPAAFVLSAGLFGLPGVPLLLLHGGFDLYLLACGAVLVTALAVAVVRLRRWPSDDRADETGDGGEIPATRLLWAPFAGLVGLLAYVAFLQTERPNGDGWVYLAYVRDHLGSGALGLNDPVSGGRDPYLSVRILTNGWLMDQAALSWVSGVEPVRMVLDHLAPVLVVLSFLALYAMGRALLGGGAALFVGCLAALLYVADQGAVVPTALMAPGGELTGRITEDKYAAWFLFLPVALTFAVLFLGGRRRRHLLGFGFVCLTVAAVHPIGLILISISALGLGLFHLLANRRDRTAWRAAWRGVAGLGLVPAAIAVPPVAYLLATGSPLLSRLEGAGNRLSQSLITEWESAQRLLSLGESSYIVHPALALNPAVLAAYVLGIPFLLLEMRRAAKPLAAQLLLGVLVVTPVFIYVPPVATFLANVLGPWVLFRLSWPLFLAVPLVLGWMLWEALSGFRAVLEIRRSDLLQALGALLPLIVVAVGVVAVAPAGLAGVRSAAASDDPPLSDAHCFDPIFRWMEDNVPASSTVLTPYLENSCVPAVAGANVLNFRGAAPQPVERQLLNFYTTTEPLTANARIVQRYEVDYVLMRADSPLNPHFGYLLGVTPLDNPGERYRLYAVDREELKPSLPNLLANDLVRQGDFSGSAARYNRALAGDEDQQFLGYQGFASWYSRQGLHAEAASSYEQALQLRPDEANLYPTLAGAYEAAGDQESAREALERGLERFPGNTNLLLSTVTFLANAGDPAAAAEVQERVVDRYPKVPEYRVRLGALLLEAGEQAAADRQFEAALRLDPHAAETRAEIGVVNQLSGREEEAVRHYERALELNPNQALAQARLEELREENGVS